MTLATDIAMSPLVAVYGTLKQGLNNAHWLSDAEWVGHEVSSALTLYDIGPYPGAKQQISQGIALEVYRVSEAQLTDLDTLEDHRYHAPHEGEYQRDLDKPGFTFTTPISKG